MVQTALSTGWDFCRRGTQEWRQARVPGHVHDDLVRHGVVADPFYRMNEKECQWVDQEDWVYRCRFSWSAKDGCPKRVLRFEGLDTVCSVYLNGSLVAEHDNMFLPLEVDVTSLLRASNELVVEFSSAVRVAESRRSAYLAKEGIAPSLSTFYERSFLRKAQYMFGWDWGPRLVSCGVWKPVVLLEYDSRVTDVRVLPRQTGGSEWEVEVAWFGERLPSPSQVTSYPEATTMRVEDDRAHFQYRAPKLWMPGLGVRHGDGALHSFSALLGTEWAEAEFGLRTIELVQEPDAFGQSFEFVVNGERVFCRGANVIPGHSFPALSDTYRPELGMNFNMVRIWGGGLYESDSFYRDCDQEGIMVWQDFPFACAYYPEDEPFLASVEAEARANIRRLRNHPSLVLWCGNNECQQMHEQKWGGAASPERFYGEKIYDDLLPRILKEEDPDRPYVHGSPSGKVEGRDCNMDGVGDTHYWDVWHGRGDWKHYEESTSRFSSEFGFASSPSLLTWSKCLDRESDWAFDSEAVKWHDKTLKGYKKYISFIELHYPKVETLEDLVYFSQLNQRDAMRHGIEHYLRSELCAGTLVWQFNDCWPSQSWSLTDSLGQRKPVAREIARLYRDFVATIRLTEDSVEFWLTNHALEAVSQLGFYGAGVVLIEDGSGVDVPFERTGGMVVPAKSSRLMATVPRASLDPQRHIVGTAAQGQEWSFRLLTEPKNLHLVAKPITVSLSSIRVGEVACASALIDPWIFDPDDFSNVQSDFPNFVEAHGRGTFDGGLNIFYEHEPRRLVARSLAGYHEVEITRGPL